MRRYKSELTFQPYFENMSSTGNKRNTFNKPRRFWQNQNHDYRQGLEKLSWDIVFDRCMDNTFSSPNQKRKMFSQAKSYLRSNRFTFVSSSSKQDKKFRFAVQFTKDDFVFETSKTFWMCHPKFTLEEWHKTISGEHLDFNDRTNLEEDIQYIGFSHCDLFDSHLEPDSELFVFLSQRKHVEVLDLSNNFLTKQSVHNIERLFKTLENLKVVLLFNNHLSEQDLLDLTQSLKTKFGPRYGVVFRENTANPYRAYIRNDTRCLIDEKPGAFIGKSIDYYSESVHDAYYNYIVKNYIKISIKNFIQNPKTISKPFCPASTSL